MTFVSRIKSSFEIVAKFESEELGLLLAEIEAGVGSFDYLMSSEGNDDWEFALEEYKEYDADERKRWAKNQERHNLDSGFPALYFESPKRVEDSWLVHFTDADPFKIIKTGMRGRDSYGIGLTVNFKEGSNPGPLAFGYPVDDIDKLDGYGKNALLLLVKEALVAHHRGDSETQAIFDVSGIKEIHPVYLEDGDYVLYSKDSAEELARCEKSEGCFLTLRDAVKG